MGEWGPWRRYTYRTGGYEYEKLQRERRVPGRRTPETESIHIPKGRVRRKVEVGTLALMLVGDEDDYGRKRDSVLNRVKAAKAKSQEEKAPQRVEGQNKGAVGGTVSSPATGTGSSSSDGPSSQQDTPAAEGSPSPSENL